MRVMVCWGWGCGDCDEVVRVMVVMCGGWCCEGDGDSVRVMVIV